MSCFKNTGEPPVPRAYLADKSRASRRNSDGVFPVIRLNVTLRYSVRAIPLFFAIALSGRWENGWIS
jgi:hypothetical protein